MVLCFIKYILYYQSFCAIRRMFWNEYMTQWVLAFHLHLPYYLQLKSGNNFVNNMTSSANKYKNKQISKFLKTLLIFTYTVYIRWNNKKLIKLKINRRRSRNIKVWLKTSHRTKTFIKNWYLGNFWTNSLFLVAPFKRRKKVWRVKSYNFKSYKHVLVFI